MTAEWRGSGRELDSVKDAGQSDEEANNDSIAPFFFVPTSSPTILTALAPLFPLYPLYPPPNQEPHPLPFVMLTASLSPPPRLMRRFSLSHIQPHQTFPTRSGVAGAWRQWLRGASILGEGSLEEKRRGCGVG